MITKVKRRGRPRQADIDTAILDAATAQISQRGYRGMTVAAVAAAAGVSEPTVYLRFPTKHDLAVAAIARRPFLTDPPHTGDAEEDLTRLLADMAETARAVGLGIIGVVLAEEPEHPELLERWRRTIGAAARRSVATIVKRGQRDHQLRSDLDATVVADLLLGVYIAKYTHEGPPDPAWPATVVHTLWPALTAR